MTEAIVSDIGSERATVGDGNKIVTLENRIHIVWQDICREGYLNQIRTFDLASKTWSDAVTLGHGLDNHARPILTTDSDGKLHVVLGGHNSPVTWRESVRSNDSSQWATAESIGEGTYPVLLCGPDDTLYLTLRANRHAGVDFYAKPKGRPWELRSRIVKNADEYREAYGAFHMQMMIGPDEVIHAVIDFYEGENEISRGIHQAVCYVKSVDGGFSWQKANGTTVDLPARPEDMDVIARSTASRVEPLPRPEISNTGLVVGREGHPCILHLSHQDAPGELFLVLPETDGQDRRPVHPTLIEGWPELRVTEARMSIGEDDTIYVVAALDPLNDAWIDGRPSREMTMTERSDQVMVMLSSTDQGQNWKTSLVVGSDRSCNAPNMETPAGANKVAAGKSPALIFFQGTRGYPGGESYYAKPVEEYLATEEFSENRVVLVLEAG